jgi:hypothetical protein
MSWVWNVMLSFSNEEHWADGEKEAAEVPAPIENINKWLEADKARNYGALADLTLASGGAGMEANVYGGGFKHCDIEAFVDVVASQDWQDRDSVQLFIQGEEADKWTIIDLTDWEK